MVICKACTQFARTSKSLVSWSDLVKFRMKELHDLGILNFLFHIKSLKDETSMPTRVRIAKINAALFPEAEFTIFIISPAITTLLAPFNMLTTLLIQESFELVSGNAVLLFRQQLSFGN